MFEEHPVFYNEQVLLTKPAVIPGFSIMLGVQYCQPTFNISEYLVSKHVTYSGSNRLIIFIDN